MQHLLAQSSSLDAIAAILGSTIYLAFAIGMYVVSAVSLMTIADKTRTPNSWWAWIPILNIVLMLQIAGLELWYIVLCFVPCVNVAVFVYMWWKIAEKRNKPGAIALLMFVPLINFFVPLYIAFADN